MSTTYIRARMEVFTRGYVTRHKELAFPDSKTLAHELKSYKNVRFSKFSAQTSDEQHLLFTHGRLSTNGTKDVPIEELTHETLDDMLNMYPQVHINLDNQLTPTTLIASLHKFTPRIPHLDSGSDADSNGEDDD